MSDFSIPPCSRAAPSWPILTERSHHGDCKLQKTEELAAHRHILESHLCAVVLRATTPQSKCQDSPFV